MAGDLVRGGFDGVTRAKLGYSRQRREEKDLAFLCAWSWGGASREKGMRPWAGGGGVSGCGDLGG